VEQVVEVMQEMLELILGEQEQLIQVVEVEVQVVLQSDPSGGAGGSGIVIVKELNKASGSWPLRAQFSSQKQGTWPKLR
jgi:hypothetical protein